MNYRHYLAIAVSLLVFLSACKEKPRAVPGNADSTESKSTVSVPALSSNNEVPKHSRTSSAETKVAPDVTPKPTNGQLNAEVNTSPTHAPDGGNAVAENSGEDFVITQDKAVSIAYDALKTSPLGRRVPPEAKYVVKFTNSRFDIVFLRPASKDPIPESGFYAVVRIDAKTGKAIVLGEP